MANVVLSRELGNVLHFSGVVDPDDVERTEGGLKWTVGSHEPDAAGEYVVETYGGQIVDGEPTGSLQGFAIYARDGSELLRAFGEDGFATVEDLLGGDGHGNPRPEDGPGPFWRALLVGDDYLQTSSLGGSIFAFDGDDFVRGEDGGDIVRLGKGEDEVRGRGGDDTLSGGKGGDKLVGNLGHDRAHGGSGDDTLEGGGGEDSLFGGRDDDLILGGPKRNLLDGGKGDDTLEGGGKARSDLYGGEGDDLILVGRHGNVQGGDGDDTVQGDHYHAFVDLGQGSDTLIMNENTLATIHDFEVGRDSIAIDIDNPNGTSIDDLFEIGELKLIYFGGATGLVYRSTQVTIFNLEAATIEDLSLSLI